MDKHQVFYNYEIGGALFKLDEEHLSNSIINDARYFTPDSWLELKQDIILVSDNYLKLDKITETIWQAMNKIIELDGYSDLTLHLEGSYYDIRDMLKDYNLDSKTK